MLLNEIVATSHPQGGFGAVDRSRSQLDFLSAGVTIRMMPAQPVWCFRRIMADLAEPSIADIGPGSPDRRHTLKFNPVGIPNLVASSRS